MHNRRNFRPMRERLSESLVDRSPAEVAEHRACAHKHAARRAFERLGIVISPKDIESQLTAIRTGTVKKVADGLGGRQLFAFPGRGRPELCAVYCPQLDAIATYLPHRNWFHLSDGVRILNKAA